MLSSLAAASLPYLSTPRGVSCSPFPFFLGKPGAGCGNSRGRWFVGQRRRGRRWFSLPRESRATEQASARKGKPSCPRAGGPSLSGPKSPSLSHASHGTFPLGHRHTDGFQCQLEHVPAQLVEVKERAGTKEPFRHSALTSQAPGFCLRGAVPLRIICELARRGGTGRTTMSLCSPLVLAGKGVQVTAQLLPEVG